MKTVLFLNTYLSYLILFLPLIILAIIIIVLLVVHYKKSKSISNEDITSTCPKCGNKIMAGKNFCTKCGTKINN